jgi:hypothetical protein
MEQTFQSFNTTGSWTYYCAFPTDLYAPQAGDLNKTWVTRIMYDDSERGPTSHQEVVVKMTEIVVWQCSGGPQSCYLRQLNETMKCVSIVPGNKYHVAIPRDGFACHLLPFLTHAVLFGLPAKSELTTFHVSG